MARKGTAQDVCVSEPCGVQVTAMTCLGVVILWDIQHNTGTVWPVVTSSVWDIQHNTGTVWPVVTSSVACGDLQ
eukprot:1157921-Pelagomonas_calceolata.AAC.10